MSETFWAIRRREKANREKNAATKATKASVKAVPVVDEPSYRDLQVQAKEMEIPANQSAEDLKAAIEEAEAE